MLLVSKLMTISTYEHSRVSNKIPAIESENKLDQFFSLL